MNHDRDQIKINHAANCSNKFYKAMKIIAKYKHAYTVTDWMELMKISKVMKDLDFKKINYGL